MLYELFSLLLTTSPSQSKCGAKATKLDFVFTGFGEFKLNFSIP